ncbi:MAG: glycosyltransferase [Roseibacillus sp.]|nr:glycosyltransferase [Roseibacillus sp.]
MRIVQAGHFQLRKYGKGQVSTELKLFNGFVRLKHNVQIFSERDTAAYEAPFGWRDLGRGKANRRLVETCENFQPQLLMLGHCDIIRNKTLAEIRRRLPDLRIAYRNVDPLFRETNAARIKARAPYVDHVFLTTAGEAAKALGDDPAKISYMPNPVDASVEVFNNSQKAAGDFDRDLFFAGRVNPDLPRFDLLRRLTGELANELRFDTFGFDGAPTVWGLDYDRALEGSKMALNLNRQEGDWLYSSARVGQLMGNGILSFIHRSGGLELFFQDKAVFFDSPDELLEKIRHYHDHDDERRQLASAGHTYVHAEMSSERVAQFVIDRTFGNPEGNDYSWSAS